MKLNIISILNTIEVENQSEKLIPQFTANSNGFDELYNEYLYYVELGNTQTMDMINFYERQYGLDYVNSKLDYSFDTPMSFNEFMETMLPYMVF